MLKCRPHINHHQKIKQLEALTEEECYLWIEIQIQRHATIRGLGSDVYRYLLNARSSKVNGCWSVAYALCFLLIAINGQ